MIHYHGTPISGDRLDAGKFFRGRHALIPFPRRDDLAAVADTARSFVFDNGAFSVWKSGKKLDVDGYVRWCSDWCRHPGFDWALIPDVIDGTEQDNDLMVDLWPSHIPGVPVWHMHEPYERLKRLCNEWRCVALGSSGEWPNPGTPSWWDRMDGAMKFVCDTHGRPPCKLHGLRMLAPAIFTRLPLASADSTNAGVNAGSKDRFGMYMPPTAAQRADTIASRIEQYTSSPVYVPPPWNPDAFGGMYMDER